MKFSTTHLPEPVRADLAHIAGFLVEQTSATRPPYQRYTPSRIRHIILHGCFTEDHWTSRTSETPATPLCPNTAYSYNLTVIVSAHLEDILPAVERAVARLNRSGKLRYPVVLRLCDTKGRIDQKLRNGYLAYDEIQARGIVIYSRGRISRDLFQVPPRPDAAEHLRQARSYYDHAFPLARLLMSGARAYAPLYRNAAAFMLNLAAAEGYEALMAVHTLAYPPGCPLYDLRELAESLHPELALLWTGLQGERIFDHLAGAFRQVRFSADYQVTTPDLDLMFGYVTDLHKLVRHICGLKFETLKAGSRAKPQKDGLAIVAEALRPSDDAVYGIAEGEDTLHTNLPVSRSDGAALTAALSGLEGHCAELLTLADILRSLTDLTAGAASACEFALMGQFVAERTRMIEETHDQITALLKPAVPAVESRRKDEKRAGAAA